MPRATANTTHALDAPFDLPVRVKASQDTVEEHEIEVWSTSNVFRAGHRLRVQVTSSNFPRWDRNPNAGEPPQTATTMRPARQRIFHDASRASNIALPVVPSQA